MTTPARTLVATRLLALALLLVLPAPARALDDAHWSALYERLRPGTVILFANGQLCAGALVAKDLVLTAWHCVSTVPDVQVRTEDAPESAVHGLVVGRDGEHDLALVRLDAPVDRPVLAMRPENEPIRSGEGVMTIGHPQAVSCLDVEPQLTFALLVGHVAKPSEDALVTNLGASQGNSGGPIVDAQGRIVSVTSEKVGLFGTVVKGPSPKHVRALVEPALRERAEPLGMWSSANRFAVQLDGLLAGRRGENGFGAWVVGVEFDFKARLSLSLQAVLSETNPGTLLGVGWRFGLRTDSALPLHVHPRVGLVSTRTAGGGEQGGAFGSLRLEIGGARVEAGGVRAQGDGWIPFLLVGTDLASL